MLVAMPFTGNAKIHLAFNQRESQRLQRRQPCDVFSRLYPHRVATLAALLALIRALRASIRTMLPRQRTYFPRVTVQYWRGRHGATPANIGHSRFFADWRRVSNHHHCAVPLRRAISSRQAILKPLGAFPPSATKVLASIRPRRGCPCPTVAKPRPSS